MEDVSELELKVERQLFVVNGEGNDVFAASVGSGRVVGNGKFFETVGGVILHHFWNPEGEELSRHVSYVIYTVDTFVSQWRTRKGGKHYRDWRSTHYEGVIFKMPKTKTLWQLIQRYRREESTLI